MQADSYMGPVIRANLHADFRTKASSFFIRHIRPCPFSAQRRPPTHSGGRRCILVFGPMQEGRRKRTVCSGSSAISIRAPVGGEVSSRTSPAQSISKFQYTPLCRGRRTGLRISELCGLFQFTPLCGGRRSRVLWLGFLILISIPAPVRGATSLIWTTGGFCMLFQFPPPRGGRQTR